jgi:hypothetical protein
MSAPRVPLLSLTHGRKKTRSRQKSQSPNSQKPNSKPSTLNLTRSSGNQRTSRAHSCTDESSRAHKQRKPRAAMVPRSSTRNMAGMNLDDDDSEEERRKKAEADFEERKARAAKERAEKERKYAEARERIFGSPAASATEESRSNSPNKPTRGKGRGGRGGKDNQPRASNEQSPARTAPPARQLFDPTYAPKPGSVYIQKKESGTSRPATPNTQEKPVRQPQGPARGGGRGFAPRGGFGQPSPS